MDDVRFVHMNPAGKVTAGVVVLVVGGLVALAAPALSGAYVQVSSWTIFQPAENVTVEPASAEEDVNGKKMIDELGDGHVYVGNGTAIPKGSPAGCEDPVWLHIGGPGASLSGDLVDRGARDLAAGTAARDDDGRIVTYTVAPGDALYAIGDRFCIANALTIAELNHTRTILAVEAMSAAAHADDIDAMREVFADELSHLLPNPADAEMIKQALDAGDLDVLRQMFA